MATAQQVLNSPPGEFLPPSSRLTSEEAGLAHWYLSAILRMEKTQLRDSLIKAKELGIDIRRVTAKFLKIRQEEITKSYPYHVYIPDEIPSPNHMHDEDDM
jgi:hypothetical protein